MNDIKLRDARKILKANGYELSYVNGDHYAFCREGSPKIVLPFHVKRGFECSYPIWRKACKRNGIEI